MLYNLKIANHGRMLQRMHAEVFMFTVIFLQYDTLFINFNHYLFIYLFNLFIYLF